MIKRQEARYTLLIGNHKGQHRIYIASIFSLCLISTGSRDGGEGGGLQGHSGTESLFNPERGEGKGEFTGGGGKRSPVKGDTGNLSRV